MEILKADASHKDITLQLLDECRSTCIFTDNKNCDFSSSSSTLEFGEEIFYETISSKNSVVFLASKDDEFIGVITVHKIPQIRVGLYVAEIEELFVKEEFQRQGVAKELVLAVVDWAISEGILNIRLESSDELYGAHAFYQKMGFEKYGKAYTKKLT